MTGLAEMRERDARRLGCRPGIGLDELVGLLDRPTAPTRRAIRDDRSTLEATRGG